MGQLNILPQNIEEIEAEGLDIEDVVSSLIDEGYSHELENLQISIVGRFTDAEEYAREYVASEFEDAYETLEWYIDFEVLGRDWLVDETYVITLRDGEIIIFEFYGH